MASQPPAPGNALSFTDARGCKEWLGTLPLTNIPQAQQYNGSWENLKVTERFTRVADDRLLYQYTIEDPTQWDQPWGGEYEFTPLNGRVLEYACHEGNYALGNVLGGAREREGTERRGANASGARPGGG